MSTASAGAGGGTFWALVPVALLAASLAGVGTMAFIASRDPGFSLERDYYDKAVHWEREQAQAQQNERLGYRLTLRAEDPSALEVGLSERSGAALRGASVRAEAFANARAGNVQSLVFVEGPNGTYRAQLGSPRAGLWEFRFRVESAGERFTEVVRTDVGAGVRAP